MLTIREQNVILQKSQSQKNEVEIRQRKSQLESDINERKSVEKRKANETAENWRRIGEQGRLMQKPGYQWGETEQSYNERMLEQQRQNQNQQLINEINRPRNCRQNGAYITCQ